jgi:DNA-binding MurR/RpiR family transcriptional regulator
MDTFRINREPTLRAVTRLLERARRIEFFAVGISYPVAYLAASKFSLIGLPASAQFDSHMQTVAATQLRKRDVAFAISCSGQTRETVHCLEVAKSKGAATVCLTNSVRSAITASADHALFAAPSEIRYFQAPLASRITQLALIDALFVSLAHRRRDRTTVQLQQAAEELLKQRLA